MQGLVTQKLPLYTASFITTPDPGGTELQDDNYNDTSFHMTAVNQVLETSLKSSTGQRPEQLQMYTVSVISLDITGDILRTSQN